MKFVSFESVRYGDDSKWEVGPIVMINPAHIIALQAWDGVKATEIIVNHVSQHFSVWGTLDEVQAKLDG